jgi:tRNA threonylcarbamoyladenosine modification (KEOPS) complex  Pcc1 subunit
MEKFPSINIDATVEIKCKDKKESKAIHDSLLPDNIDIPKNLKLDMKMAGSSIALEIKFSSNIGDGKNIETLLNTFDELMEHAGIIGNVIKND